MVTCGVASFTQLLQKVDYELVKTVMADIVKFRRATVVSCFSWIFFFFFFVIITLT